ncbi:MAG TPA: hypothetical protein VGD01_11470 [Candidatus Elarobacter sp.]|jgi:hypothetical protein
MRDERLGAIALIAGAVTGIVTLAFHPTAHEFLDPGSFAAFLLVNRTIHTLALIGVVLSFLGALALTARLDGPRRIAVAALVLFGMAEVAVTIAAAASGFVAPTAIHQVMAGGPDVAIWKALGQYTAVLNQAFAKIYVLASASAIVLWSVAMLRARGFHAALAGYGIVLGAVLLAVTWPNLLPLDVHGFGAVVLGEGIWMIVAGVTLWGLAPAQETC